jgi:hypothetical protein
MTPLGRHSLRFIAVAAAMAITVMIASAGEITLDDFSHGLDPDWKEKSFSGHTVYELVHEDEDGRSCIKATSRKAASGLYHEIDFDPETYPIITWNWKIDGIIASGDARYKATDDYAARIYIVFPSFFFWRTKAINYIWANKLAKGEMLPNAYTGNDVMVAVESGPERTGQWVTEKRNIVEDYRRAFGGRPPRAGAIAIMTDTDNTGGQATACYGPIRLLSGADD